MVFISVSKIQFESKSQQRILRRPWSDRCLSVCQRYNLKANHNLPLNVAIVTAGVYQCVKDTIWKQITTILRSRHQFPQVFISVSKIQFESKSQHRGLCDIYGLRCLSVCQRYNLKANHNATKGVHGRGAGVYQCVKDTIWKQITTSLRTWMLAFLVFISVSKIQFESKSQLVTPAAEWTIRCLSVCQRYNLKANHNTIQVFLIGALGVYQCVKDTIWKQITTT